MGAGLGPSTLPWCDVGGGLVFVIFSWAILALVWTGGPPPRLRHVLFWRLIPRQSLPAHEDMDGHPNWEIPHLIYTIARGASPSWAWEEDQNGRAEGSTSVAKVSLGPGNGQHIGEGQEQEAGDRLADRVRVGFLSSHFFEHSVGRLLTSVICGLDEDVFEVWVIHVSVLPSYSLTCACAFTCLPPRLSSYLHIISV